MNPLCIVDDEPSICSTVANILGDEGYPTLVFPDAETFWQGLDTMEPALVLVDIWLPGLDGMQLLKRLHDRFPLLPIIMMSGHAGIEAAVAAITGKKVERAVASLFTPGGTHAMKGEFQGINDFEVVAFLVVLPEAANT